MAWHRAESARTMCQLWLIISELWWQTVPWYDWLIDRYNCRITLMVLHNNILYVCFPVLYAARSIQLLWNERRMLQNNELFSYLRVVCCWFIDDTVRYCRTLCEMSHLHVFEIHCHLMPQFQVLWKLAKTDKKITSKDVITMLGMVSPHTSLWGLHACRCIKTKSKEAGRRGRACNTVFLHNKPLHRSRSKAHSKSTI